MHLVRRLILVATLLAVPLCFADKPEDWLPITQQDLQMKEVPGKPGAPAVQLFYEQFDDDASFFEFIYHRIKILNDKGKDFARVEVPVISGFSVVDLKARVIHPDGKIIEFTDKPLDQTVIKGHGVKIHTKTILLPEVTVGSIIEYKYKITWEPYFVIDSLWVLKHNLYTVKELFRIKPYRGPLDVQGGRLTYAYLNIVTGGIAPEKRRPPGTPAREHACI